MSTFSGTITTGIVLTSGTQNPVTVAAGAYVTNSTTLHSGDAVYGSTAAAWNIDNLGRINATGTASAGIYLRAGGTVTNAATALISGVLNGVYISGSTGTVNNSGTIKSTGTSSDGIFLTGGIITNGATSTTSALISGGFDGVLLAGSTSTVSNFGTIQGTGGAGVGLIGPGGAIRNYGTIRGTGPKSFGVFLDPLGGGVGAVSNASGAVISGLFGVDLYGTASTVTNFGTIEGIGTGGIADGVYMLSGTLTNGATNSTSALISGVNYGVRIAGTSASTVSNFGSITGTGTAGEGIFIYTAAGGGGHITNSSSGVIAGVRDGIDIGASGGTGSGTVVNSGRISASETAFYRGAGDGIYLSTGGGVVTNNLGGTITGPNNGVEVDSAVGTVSNSGSITGTGTAGYGIYIYTAAGGGGHVTNTSSGVIVGVRDGINIGSTAGTGSGTVVNSGTIAATSNALGYGDGILLSTGGGVVTNNLGGAITGQYNGVAIYSGVGTVSNSGSISGTGTAGFGIYIYTGAGGGGHVSNTSSGVIAGFRDGINIGSTAGIGSGTVVNFGRISASQTAFYRGAGDGIYLSTGGGVVTNNLGGTITGPNNGVEVDSAVGTVSNSGSITGTGTAGYGIYIYTAAGGGGRVTNSSSGVIVGVRDGINIGSTAGTGSGTVVNSGTIAATSNIGDGIYLSTGGGVVTNNLGGTITGPNNGVEIDSAVGIVSNYGSITGTGTAGFGIYLYGGGGFVTNKAGGTIRGVSRGVDVYSLTGTVTNSGTITATATTGVGVYLRAGSVTNLGWVTAGTNGIGISVFSGNVTNSGTIIATGSSAKAVYVRYGTFFNSGLVSGAVSGIELSLATGTAGSGRVTVSGTVIGATGISVAPTITAGQTVTVSGAVTGTGGTAVSLGGLTGRLIVDPGAVFSGVIDGGHGSSVLEIAPAGGVGASKSYGALGAANAVAYVPLGGVQNFNALQVDSSATLDGSGALSFATLTNQGQINVASGDSLAIGTVASAANPGTINLVGAGTITFTGSVASQTLGFNSVGGLAAIDQPGEFLGTTTDFAAGDTIDLPLGKATFLQYSAGVLGLSYLGATVDLSVATPYASPEFLFTADNAGGTDITVQASPPPPPPPPSPPPPCYCRGTLIRTEAGEVPVERLAIGDRVVTLSGALKPVVWIGFGRSLVTRRNSEARPIIVRRGALGDNVPARDLYLSHGHALYFDGVLIPVEHLVNHRSIRWDDAARVVEYYHVELADHDVLFAEGAPAETYHDSGNRASFHNARPGAPAGADKPTFAPVLHGGDRVGEVWAELFARAGGRIERNTTDNADLHLVLDGERINPTAVAGGVYHFTVERPPAAALRLRSRAAVPSLLGFGRHDHRPLGIAIERIILDHAGIATSFDYDAPQLREAGCHPPEDGYSWTAGDLDLPMRFFSLLNGCFTLVVHTKPHYDMRYPISPPVARAA